MRGIISYLKSLWQCRFLIINVFVAAMVGGAVGGLLILWRVK